ncbi:NAD(P)H-binding protein [Nocardia terpenica]|uniref:NmrA family NAD(P)-binding protein n=1 Tax=Nocardia terpenica TaxID=455432 RepID=UPI0018957D2D|nr:NAD(P)H-binding protein [Nocardia terpenica]MBF6062028.1 NAD(P)H-binding protein [Nocardia terpenica]MBF6106172.1 NAD(P)H-binding protein [Nocardia terpenica]MBF6110448.1 NAD(P)H-binding protein [Nocardia terpenica]MBF6120715.1 NAD(P)H-binding protein [Nocardia terpenica]MBF6151784.1 NAD(P)H-binding protein [Nocardia terpenica]
MTILITTPNGTVGRHVTAALRDRDDVRFFVRSEASMEALGDVRGEVVRGDATDAADVRRAVAGVDRLFLAHPFAEDQIVAETTLGATALEAGTRRIVKLGARAFGDGIVHDPVTAAHDVITARLLAVGVPELSVLRPDRFLQNFLSSAQAIASGTLADPAGPGSRGYVDARDIAEVAVAELLSDNPIGGDIELSGPQLMTLQEIADSFATVLGRPVRHIDIPLDDAWRARLLARGVEPWIVDGLRGLYTNYRLEGTAALGDGVQRVLGRSPRSVEAFAADLLRP